MTSSVDGVARNAVSTSQASRTATDQANHGVTQARGAVTAVNGFAVVADEVRALAARTQASTVEVEQMIGSIQSRADLAVVAMDRSHSLVVNTQQLAMAAGEALEQIAAGIASINDRNLAIASACEEQAQVAREVDKNLVNIQDLSTQTAAGAHQTTASAQELSRLAISFNDLVGRFKLSFSAILGALLMEVSRSAYPTAKKNPHT